MDVPTALLTSALRGRAPSHTAQGLPGLVQAGPYCPTAARQASPAEVRPSRSAQRGSVVAALQGETRGSTVNADKQQQAQGTQRVEVRGRVTGGPGDRDSGKARSAPAGGWKRHQRKREREAAREETGALRVGVGTRAAYGQRTVLSRSKGPCAENGAQGPGPRSLPHAVGALPVVAGEQTFTRMEADQADCLS